MTLYKKVRQSKFLFLLKNVLILIRAERHSHCCSLQTKIITMIVKISHQVQICTFLWSSVQNLDGAHRASPSAFILKPTQNLRALESRPNKSLKKITSHVHPQKPVRFQWDSNLTTSQPTGCSLCWSYYTSNLSLYSTSNKCFKEFHLLLN